MAVTQGLRRLGTGGINGLAAIVVTYHPDLQCLAKLLDVLPQEVRLIVVDNNSPRGDVEAVGRLLAQREGTRLIRNDVNAGIAAAINQGSAALHAEGVEFLLLLDQDSIPHPGAIGALFDAFLRLEANGGNVGCVGPRLIDPSTGLEHGFHQIRRLRWVRAFPRGDGSVPIRCANLNGSGTLMRAGLFDRVGGLDEGLFIDHVDTDWSFRVIDFGMSLFAIPDAVFDHAMGERGLRFWFMGWRVWPVRSPRRHYFLFRNSITLMRRAYVPAVWKCWAIVKLAATLVLHALFDSRRRAQLVEMLRGLRDGVRLGG